jgi:AcrR family transcriptional regulator
VAMAGGEGRDEVSRPGESGSERIRRAADELFGRHGVRDVGVDAVVARAGTARMTLHRNFSSKDDLILDFLRRERRWTEEWLERESDRRGERPQDKLLATSDLFDEWFGTADFEGCAFLTTMIECSEGPAQTPSFSAASRVPSTRFLIFVKATSRA